jgi:hypothetical protein
MFLQNVVIQPQDYMAQQPERPLSQHEIVTTSLPGYKTMCACRYVPTSPQVTLPREPQISHTMKLSLSAVNRTVMEAELLRYLSRVSVSDADLTLIKVWFQLLHFNSH